MQSGAEKFAQIGERKFRRRGVAGFEDVRE
jgi:hypothetical protein